MKLGKAIFSILTNNAPVSGVVGVKVFPKRSPQSTVAPLIIYAIASVVPSETKTSVSKLDTFRLQASCHSTTYAQADDLAVKVRTALDRYSGTVEGVVIQSVRFDSVQDDYDDDAREDIKVLDFMIRVKN